MNEKLAEKIFAKHREVVELSKLTSASKLLLGKHLFELKQGKKYQAISGEDTTWRTYLADAEISQNPDVVGRWIKVYRVFVAELGIPIEELYGVDILKLFPVSAVITKETQEDWFHKMKTLSRSDIYRILKYPDKDVMTCEPHAWEPNTEKCSKCGEVKRI